MSDNKVISLQQYIRWLVAQYQTLPQKKQRDAYRIVGQENRNGQCLLTVQVVGKSITFKVTPEELAGDDQILELFSRKDIRTIVYYACNEIKKPRYKIILQEFCSKLGRMIFGVQKRGDENLITITPEEISLNKEVLNNLSQEDAHLVGYASATERMATEKQQMQQLANESDTKNSL